MIHESILGTIGNTPVVRINKLAPAGTTMYVKCEAFNPLSSVKDRLAIGIIEDAERRGTLKPGQTVIEMTSGNTGIALAMVCAVKGYPFVAIMPDSFSVERRKLMRILGAKVILTPAAERASGAVKKGEELARKNGWFLARQFENPANPEYHRNTTGPEILLDFVGRRLDWWVTGYGTGGTLTGVSDVLRAARPEVKIAVVEPEGAALLAGKEWKPHKIQGWTPDFIPAVLDRHSFDELVTVTDTEARDAARDLAAKEGIFCGISSGGNFAGAKKIAEKAGKGSVVLAMLPDTGERYLSTILFEGISEGSDEEPADGLPEKKRGRGWDPARTASGSAAARGGRKLLGGRAATHKPPSPSSVALRARRKPPQELRRKRSRQRPGCREWREPESRRDSRHPPARPSRRPSGTASN